MPVGGRGAGKFGYANTFHTNTGRSYHDINEEIIWVSIGMAVTIGILTSTINL